jgi:hypothetical protein
MLELCIGEVLVGFDIFSFYLGSSLGAGQWRFLKGFTGFSTGWEGSTRAPQPDFFVYISPGRFNRRDGTGRSHRLAWSIAQARQQDQKQSHQLLQSSFNLHSSTFARLSMHKFRYTCSGALHSHAAQPV